MRVLIATVTAGGGHLAAAAALHEAWQACRPDDVLEQVDLVKFFSPLHRKIHADGYLKLVNHAPELWGMMFGKTDNPAVAQRLNRFRRLFPSNSRKRFARCVEEFGPDVVLCTHYLPLETLGRMRRQTENWSRAPRRTRKPGVTRMAVSAAVGSAGSANGTATAEVHASERRSLRRRPAPGSLTVSIVTDFEAHALWMDSCVDLYCVAAEETKARLVARGAMAKQAIVTGIPVAGKFSLKPEAKAVRKALGLRDDQPVLLVLSGGFGMGPVGEIVARLDKMERPFQTVVVTGHNDELRRDLAARDRRHPTHVLGYASNMHELMAVADLIVTKPGGLTSSEVLAMGKPLLIVNPIPGQEAANSDFLLEHGAAAKVNRVEDLPFRVEQLLGSKKLADLARAAKALGRPRAARCICEEVSRRAAARTA